MMSEIPRRRFTVQRYNFFLNCANKIACWSAFYLNDNTYFSFQESIYFRTLVNFFRNRINLFRKRILTHGTFCWQGVESEFSFILCIALFPYYGDSSGAILEVPSEALLHLSVVGRWNRGRYKREKRDGNLNKSTKSKKEALNVSASAVYH